ncbi:MAG TPA: hypothetical protein VJ916_02150 [Anaerovoracaceae bacterium]|nr:hypothetical protein [Anaerovoracaceae bacterium]
MDKKKLVIIGSFVALVISSLAIFVYHDPFHIIIGVIIGVFASTTNLFLMEFTIIGAMLHNNAIKAAAIYFFRLLIYAIFAFLSCEFSLHGALGYGIGVASLNITLVIFFRKVKTNERR